MIYAVQVRTSRMTSHAYTHHAAESVQFRSVARHEALYTRKQFYPIKKERPICPSFPHLCIKHLDLCCSVNHGAQRILLEKIKVAQLVRKHPSFMEPEDSLPCSQELAAGSYPEPVESSPQFPNLFP
jgi:hypothetical protein